MYEFYKKITSRIDSSKFKIKELNIKVHITIIFDLKITKNVNKNDTKRSAINIKVYNTIILI